MNMCFVFSFNIFIQVIMIFRFINLAASRFVVFLFFYSFIVFCCSIVGLFLLGVPTLSENIRKFFSCKYDFQVYRVGRQND